MAFGSQSTKGQTGIAICQGKGSAKQASSHCVCRKKANSSDNQLDCPANQKQPTKLDANDWIHHI